MAGLTELKLRALKPKAKLYRVADADGLCIEIHPAGGRYWRYRYRYAGKAKMLSLGTYPEVSLAEARGGLAKERRRVRDGVDPSVHRKAAEIARRVSAASTFEAVADEWLNKQAAVVAPVTLAKATWLLRDMAFPAMGTRPIGEIEPPAVLAMLLKVEETGRHETTHRLKQKCSQVFRYAIATHRAKRDPTADLRGALTATTTKHHASVTDPVELGHLLRAIEGYRGEPVTSFALRLAPLLFVRPGELRNAEWSEIDLDAGQWRIPGEKMKMRDPHIVPLSLQAVAMLRELQPLTGRASYVFPGVRSWKRPMSENTVNAALRRLGYTTDQMTVHGFRSTASTRLHEMGWPSAVIERQLAHAERNKVKAAYNYAEHLPERRKMMQAWADYLDSLARGDSKVVPLRSA